MVSQWENMPLTIIFLICAVHVYQSGAQRCNYLITRTTLDGNWWQHKSDKNDREVYTVTYRQFRGGQEDIFMQDYPIGKSIKFSSYQCEREESVYHQHTVYYLRQQVYYLGQEDDVLTNACVKLYQDPAQPQILIQSSTTTADNCAVVNYFSTNVNIMVKSDNQATQCPFESNKYFVSVTMDYNNPQSCLGDSKSIAYVNRNTIEFQTCITDNSYINRMFRCMGVFSADAIGSQASKGHVLILGDTSPSYGEPGGSFYTARYTVQLNGTIKLSLERTIDGWYQASPEKTFESFGTLGNEVDYAFIMSKFMGDCQLGMCNGRGECVENESYYCSCTGIYYGKDCENALVLKITRSSGPLQEGDYLILSCSAVNGNSNVTFRWLFLPEGARSAVPLSERPSYWKFNVTAADTGTYVCKGAAGNTTTQTNVTVTVVDSSTDVGAFEAQVQTPGKADGWSLRASLVGGTVAIVVFIMVLMSVWFWRLTQAEKQELTEHEHISLDDPQASPSHDSVGDEMSQISDMRGLA